MHRFHIYQKQWSLFTGEKKQSVATNRRDHYTVAICKSGNEECAYIAIYFNSVFTAYPAP